MKQDQNKPAEATGTLPVLDSNRCGGQQRGGLRLGWTLSPASDLRWVQALSGELTLSGLCSWFCWVMTDTRGGEQREPAAHLTRGTEVIGLHAGVQIWALLQLSVSVSDQQIRGDSWLRFCLRRSQRRTRTQDRVPVLVLSPLQSSEFEFKPRVL